MIKLEVTISQLTLRVECDRPDVPSVMNQVNALIGAAIAEPIRQGLALEDLTPPARVVHKALDKTQSVPLATPAISEVSEVAGTQRVENSANYATDHSAKVRPGEAVLLASLRDAGPCSPLTLSRRLGLSITGVRARLSQMKKRGLAVNDHNSCWHAMTPELATLERRCDGAIYWTPPDEDDDEEGVDDLVEEETDDAPNDAADCALNPEVDNLQPEIKSDDDGEPVVFRHVRPKSETNEAADETPEPLDVTSTAPDDFTKGAEPVESSSNEPAEDPLDQAVLEDIRQHAPTTKEEIAKRLNVDATALASDPLNQSLKRLVRAKRIKHGWRNKWTLAKIEDRNGEGYSPLEHFLDELPIGRRDIVKRSGCSTPAELAQLGRRGLRAIPGAATHTAQHLADWLKRRFGLELAD